MQRRFRSRNAPPVAVPVLMEAVETRLLMSTYTVKNTNDSGPGSLRQAILDANKTTAADTIKFAIGSGAKTISPRSQLPGISQPLLIDGSSQPGFSGKPLVEISGTSAGAGAFGLKLISTGVTIKNLVINRFGQSGVFIYQKGGDKVIGCYIGTDRSGAAPAGNVQHGILVQAPNNTIGGLNSAERNVISGNPRAGVFLYTSAANHNTIIGNFVGTDSTGTKKVPNHLAGVQVNGGAYNTIGGLTSSARNVISGNDRDGVLIVTGGSQHNTVQGNYIGTSAAGTARLGNGWYGVEVSQPNNLVGGTTSSARNIVSANGHGGIVLYLNTAVGNKVQGNYVGTDSTGKKDLGNTGAGIEMTNGANHNTVGGDSSACRNIVAGNDMSGIGIYNGATYNTVKNNWVGICADGCALTNAKSGILVVSATNNILTSNKIAVSGTYNALQLNSGTGGTSTGGNTTWSKVTIAAQLL